MKTLGSSDSLRFKINHWRGQTMNPGYLHPNPVLLPHHGTEAGRLTWFCTVLVQDGAALVGKESACNAGDLGSIPGLGRSPGGGHGDPLQYSCLENPHGQRSLVGYSPWGRKESDATKHSTAHCRVTCLDLGSWALGERKGKVKGFLLYISLSKLLQHCSLSKGLSTISVKC